MHGRRFLGLTSVSFTLACSGRRCVWRSLLPLQHVSVLHYRQMFNNAPPTFRHSRDSTIFNSTALSHYPLPLQTEPNRGASCFQNDIYTDTVTLMSSDACRVALVTGAARRIGAAIARKLHADGLSVCVHYGNSRTDALALVAELNGIRPGSAAAVQASLDVELIATDVTLETRCDALLDSCYEAFGRCDVLVNNASTYVPTPLIDRAEDKVTHAETTARLLSTFGSNAIAPLFLTQAFARRHEHSVDDNEASNTCIINMVDAMTNQPLLHFTAYTMAKHALEGLTKSAALELSGLRIRVNGVGPGLSCLPVTMPPAEQAVYRQKVPLGQREASAEVIAEAVSFLVSDKAKYITGSLLNVDGAWSLTRA